MRALTLLILVIFISCNSRQTNRNSKLLERLEKEKELQFKLLGRWGSLKVSIWEISTDSIYYLQEAKAFSYTIIGNNFVVDHPDSKGVLRDISVINDTMTFLDERGLKVFGYRHKKAK